MSERARALPSRRPVRRDSAGIKPRSPSIEILKRSLDAAGVNRRTFVNETGLSYEYVSRIFNSKVKFPAVRETLEKFAEVARIDPMLFVEYQQLVSVLPVSTRKLWERLQDLGLSRQEFARQVPVSRTYMYEILRGDVPFPRNPEVIEKIATAAGMAPEAFSEYLAPVQDWADRNPGAIEHVFMNLLVSKMLVARGYAAQVSSARHLSDEMLKIFPPDDRYEPWVRELFREMGRRGLGVRQVAEEAGVSEQDVRLIVMGQVQSVDLPHCVQALQTTFGLN
ncbi:MAG: helix-turn-helix transcriptional regulator [Candidatus Sericytochromatia bacterium]|nr:helix-turn-helix transcriptional regulator [Candidatus Sericytochromatia bacterium]